MKIELVLQCLVYICISSFAHSSPSVCYEEEPRLSESWERADKVALGAVTQNLKDEDVPEGLNTTEREGDTISVSSIGSTKKTGVHLFEVTSPLKNTRPGERIKILYSYFDSVCRSTDCPSGNGLAAGSTYLLFLKTAGPNHFVRIGLFCTAIASGLLDESKRKVILNNQESILLTELKSYLSKAKKR